MSAIGQDIHTIPIWNELVGLTLDEVRVRVRVNPNPNPNPNADPNPNPNQERAKIFGGLRCLGSRNLNPNPNPNPSPIPNPNPNCKQVAET